MTEHDTTQQDAGFREWALLELFGHRRLAGLVTEVELAGDGFLRLDVYPGDAQEPMATQLYAPKAVYAITPVAESLARKFAAANEPAPVTRWDLPEVEAPALPCSVAGGEAVDDEMPF